MRISLQDLPKIVGKGARVVTITARTIPSLKKNTLGEVVKIAKVNGMIGTIYENAVNRQRLREGLEADFEAEPRKWGKRVKGTPFVEHKGNLYLEMKVEKSEHVYEVNGVRVDEEMIKPFLKDSSSSQGVENEVILRDYKAESIQQLTYAGTTYEIAE